MSPNILVYVLRRDLRWQDNPIFHHIVQAHQSSRLPFTHVLPIYVFPANQIELSGFLSSASEQSPYPEARSSVAGFWRCGPHRAKFIAESVFDLQYSLQAANSGLVVRVGTVGEVLRSVFGAYASDEDGRITNVWMTAEEGVEERREEQEAKAVTDEFNAKFKTWVDEKYFIDDRDLPYERISDLPDVFTSYRNRVEPLRDAPRKTVKLDGKLPPLPNSIPDQFAPFITPVSFGDTLSRLLKPVESKPDIADMSRMPSGAESAHPFQGGEKEAHNRIKHIIETGAASTYKDTRNGMIGTDFSTKLSAWLALGSITARQVHEYLLDFEDGRTELGNGAQGYAKGQNKGTGWIRFELLWRDYMRLCCRKYRHYLFRVEGMKKDRRTPWKYPGHESTNIVIDRFLRGNTGTSLIDASMRELYHTGYTSNRARQNVASFLARHLGVDWRVGAEYYESLDYDVSSNWGNWQSNAITDRTFNPIKQSFDYDAKGEYIKTWVEELRSIEDNEGLFQPWKIAKHELEAKKLQSLQTVVNPLKRIDFRPGNKHKDQKRSKRR